MGWNVSSGSVFDWEPGLFSFPECIPTARLIQLPKEAEMLEVIWRSALIVSLSQFRWNAREGKQTFPWTHDRSSWTSLKKSHNAPLHRRLQTRHRGCRGGFGGSPGSESCTIQLACCAFVLSGWKRWAVQRFAPFISLNRRNIPIPNYCFSLGWSWRTMWVINNFYKSKDLGSFPRRGAVPPQAIFSYFPLRFLTRVL